MATPGGRPFLGILEAGGSSVDGGLVTNVRLPTAAPVCRAASGCQVLIMAGVVGRGGVREAGGVADVVAAPLLLPRELLVVAGLGRLLQLVQLQKVDF